MFDEEQQKEVDRIIGERLAKEKTKYQELETTYKQLKSEYEDFKTNYSELEVQASEVSKLKRDALVVETLEEAGLPKRFANRITGETREEILADANSLKADLEATEDSVLPRRATDPDPVKRTGLNAIVDHAIEVHKQRK